MQAAALEESKIALSRRNQGWQDEPRGNTGRATHHAPLCVAVAAVLLAQVDDAGRLLHAGAAAAASARRIIQATLPLWTCW